MRLRHRKTLFLSLFLSIVFFCSSASAESSTTFGAYTIHFNAIQTDILDPKIAKNYDIKRSSKRGLLNIAVRKGQHSTALGTPSAASVSSNWSNLIGQMGSIEMREIREKDAIYYIGEFAIRNEEVLTFSIIITPAGTSSAKKISFRKQFIVD